jgi:integrase
VIVDMPRPRPPHLHRQVTQHGKTVWYVRIGKGPRVRIRADFGSPDFDAEYQAAITGAARPQRVKGEAVGSLGWLIARYRETTAWAALSAATRRQRENIFRHVIESAGDKPFAKIDSATIVAGRERRTGTPAQARNFLDAMRGLFRWAAEAKLVRHDPTVGVRNPPRKASDGFISWTEEHVAMYQRRWPIGTRQRVWLDVLLYSGLRRGDAVRYGRQHVQKGVGRIKTEKSGFAVMAIVPVLQILAETLAAGPCGDLTFIVGERGQPFTKESFGNAFREACRAAGIPGSAHGVRKIAATTAANNGATTSQLKALFGWTSDAMPTIYTRAADRERLGREAGHMLENASRTSIPSPKRKVRAPERKGQR